MKKTKLFIALGAVVLSAGAFLVTKANKKFTAVTHAAFNGMSGTLSSAAHFLSTVKGTGYVTAYFSTRNASSGVITNHTLVTTSIGNARVYFKP